MLARAQFPIKFFCSVSQRLLTHWKDELWLGMAADDDIGPRPSPLTAAALKTLPLALGLASLVRQPNGKREHCCASNPRDLQRDPNYWGGGCPCGRQRTDGRNARADSHDHQDRVTIEICECGTSPPYRLAGWFSDVCETWTALQHRPSTLTTLPHGA